MLGIYLPTTAIELVSGEKGIVRAVHIDAPLRPLITIFYDKNGVALPKPLIVDLKEESLYEGRKIVSPLDINMSGIDPNKKMLVDDSSLLR